MLGGLAGAVGLILQAFIGAPPASAWIILDSVILASGVQLVAIGVLGKYIGRIYSQVKQRTLYIIQQEIGGP